MTNKHRPYFVAKFYWNWGTNALSMTIRIKDWNPFLITNTTQGKDAHGTRVILSQALKVCPAKKQTCLSIVVDDDHFLVVRSQDAVQSLCPSVDTASVIITTTSTNPLDQSKNVKLCPTHPGVTTSVKTMSRIDIRVNQIDRKSLKFTSRDTCDGCFRCWMSGLIFD